MLSVIILAAGKGTRMKDTIPKVCQKIQNKTMIEYVVSTALSLNPDKIYIIVSKENRVKIQYALIGYPNLIFVEQNQVNGTGSAVLSAESFYKGTDILVLLGDVPFLTSNTLKKVISSNCCILGFQDNNVKNKFGRIIHENGKVDRIVEYNEATDEQKQVKSVNSGILFLKDEYTDLFHEIDNNNSKGEYYLTDIVGICKRHDITISYIESYKDECIGINTKEELNRVKLLK